ncbi:hypothetical protein OG943_40235 [Amycolatopsis sp. NBC_00345]|uniref:hypothetical protein n=1 Tax=Amycolatopsis sp. NBC_00345 TaxID=2975955 RepID=UPI002E26AD82
MSNKINEMAQYAESHDFADEMAAGQWETDVVEDPMISTSIRLPKSVMDQVRRAAELDKVKPTAWIRRLVESALTQQPAADAATSSSLEERVSGIEEVLIASIEKLSIAGPLLSDETLQNVAPQRLLEQLVQRTKNTMSEGDIHTVKHGDG